MTNQNRDTVFKEKKNFISNFVFDESVARVFDDMLERSIPFYHEIHKILLELVLKIDTNHAIYDLGCSTGQTLVAISKQLANKNHGQLYGIDNSKSMIDKCIQKFKDYKVENVSLTQEDLSQITFQPSSLIIMNYTLQFIPTNLRNDLLVKIFNALKPGGVFFLAEKIKSTDSVIENYITDSYYDFKRRNGYSELEISQKRESLEKVLIPVTPTEQIEQLKKAGFNQCDMIFRWYNFATYMCVK